MKKIYLFLLLFFSVLFANAASFVLAKQPNYVTAHLIADTKAVVPGHSFKLGVQLTLEPGWHVYYKNPGDAGIPTKIVWQLPTGFHTTDLYWQKPTRFDEGGIITYGYTKQTLISTNVTPPAQLDTSKNINFSAQIKWLSCKGICVPGSGEAHLTLPVISSQKAQALDLSTNTQEFATATISDAGNPDLTAGAITRKSTNTEILTYFAFALIGGFLLNFMPCVLPVVAIKILGLIEQTDKESIRKTVIAFFKRHTLLVFNIRAACCWTAICWTENRLGFSISTTTLLDDYVFSCIVICSQPFRHV